MNQLKMNEHGLAESLESVLCQIVALLNVTQNALDGSESSIYMRDAVQMLNAARNLAIEAEQYRSEWEKLILQDRG